jgi:hypothetical protein
MPVSAWLSDYRKVQDAGILVPHVITEATSKGTQIVRVEQVTVNSPSGHGDVQCKRGAMFYIGGSHLKG